MVAVLAGALLGGGAVFGFSPVVRWLVAREIRGLELVVTVDAAVPAWEGLRLRGVSASIEGQPGLRVWLDELVVDWRTRRPLVLRGGKVVALGDPTVLAALVLDWRARRAAPGPQAQGQGGAEGPLELEDATLDWRRSGAGDADSVRASFSRVARGSSGRWMAELVTLRGKGRLGSIAVEGGIAEVSSTGDVVLLHRLEADSASVERHAADVAADVGAHVAADVADGAELPVVPVVAEATGASRGLVQRAQAAQKLLLGIVEQVDLHLADEARVSVKSARFQWPLAGEDLQVGPGLLELRREPGTMALQLTPTNQGSEGSRPLMFHVAVPRGGIRAVKPVPLRAEIRGGPITLAQLGLKDGDFGLGSVAKTTVTSDVRLELSPDSAALTLDGGATVKHLSLSHARLAHEVVDGLDVALRGRVVGKLDGSALSMTGGEVDLGQLKVQLNGAIRRKTSGGTASSFSRDAVVELGFEFPLTNCQAAFDSLPRALIPNLHGMRFAGAMSAKGHARFDMAQLDKTFDVLWDGVLGCRVLEAPSAIEIANFRKPFQKLVYTPEGVQRAMTFGPGTPAWVPFTQISKFMEVGVLICEDGRFRRHHGFDQEAIIHSLHDNLAAGGFKRGASTLTMQLAKNLFLSRDKVLARKLQEAILTVYLEQELTKQEILELYFNIVEFGPMVYGVGPAARHWFNSSAHALSLGQSLYLAASLQNPKKQYFGEGGVVVPGRMGYLQKLMKLGQKIHLISPEEAAEGLSETLVFGRPAAPAELAPAPPAPPLSDEASSPPHDGNEPQ